MAINLPTIDESKVRIVGALGDHPNVDNNMTAQDLRDAFDQDAVNIREFLNPTVAGSFGNVLKTKIESMETSISAAQSAATATITASRIGSGAVTTGKIAGGAVTTAKLDQTSGSQAVTTATIRDGNVTAAKIAANAVSTVYTGTISTSSWSGSTAPYSAAITVSGILASDTPIIDVTMSGTYSTDAGRDENWGHLYRAVTSANTITFYAKSKPTVSLPFAARCIRK